MKADKDADGIIYDPVSRKILVSCGDAGVLIPISADVDSKTGMADPPVVLGGKPEFLVAAQGMRPRGGRRPWLCRAGVDTREWAGKMICWEPGVIEFPGRPRQRPRRGPQ